MSDTQIYQSLVEGAELPSLSRYVLEQGLARALVQAIAEQNMAVFGSAQSHLNTMATQNLTVMGSGYCHRDVRAAKSVAREIGWLPNDSHIPLPGEFENDFIRIWSLSAQLDNWDLFDQMLPHAVRKDITPFRCPENNFDGKIDAVRWDVYKFLSQRNELGRLQQLESHFNFVQHTLSTPPLTMQQLMSHPPLMVAIGIICESVKHEAWETFEWLVNTPLLTPTPFLLQMVSGMCLTAPPQYLDKMFEVFPDHHKWIFHFFDHDDKSGKSTVGLNPLLARVDHATDECLQYLVSEAYENNTTRRSCIAQYAQSLLQHRILSEAVDVGTASAKKVKI